MISRLTETVALSPDPTLYRTSDLTTTFKPFSALGSA